MSIFKQTKKHAKKHTFTLYSLHYTLYIILFVIYYNLILSVFIISSRNELQYCVIDVSCNMHTKNKCAVIQPDIM